MSEHNLTNFQSIIKKDLVLKEIPENSLIAIGIPSEKAISKYKPAAISGKSLIDIIKKHTGSGGGGGSVEPIEILEAELQALVIAGSLKPNAEYHVTDRDIWIGAKTATELNISGRRRMEIIKESTYSSPSISPVFSWNGHLTLDMGDKIIWGGKVWDITKGNMDPVPPSDSVPHSSFVSIDSDSRWYEMKMFNIKYDVSLGIITEQSDDRGNVITPMTSVGIGLGNGVDGQPVNYLEITDWGNPTVRNNKCHGVFNNTAGFVENNTNTGIIRRNYTSQGVNDNSNLGDISGNYCTIPGSGTHLEKICIRANSNKGSILNNGRIMGVTQNSNNGEISDNVSTSMTDIRSNSNNGEITDNALGILYFNSNNGSIVNNTAGDYNGVRNNNNNGDIRNNSKGGFNIFQNNNNSTIINEVTGAHTTNLP